MEQSLKRVCSVRHWTLPFILISVAVVGVTLAQHDSGSAADAVDFEKGGWEAALVKLNEHNWNKMLTEEWMVEFYAPWCPACKNLAPTWDRFATAAYNSLGVSVAKIDVTTSPSLSGRFFVTALPTIYHVKDGEFRQYRGSRDFEALMTFIKEKQWRKIEPLSSWKKPDTIHMSILSYFFKLSHTLKDFNVRLQDEYGLPTWGSYALFAIGTIFVGAALGLMLVCLVDFLYPPKKSQRQSFSDSKEENSNKNFNQMIDDMDEIGDDDEDVEDDDDDDDNEEDGDDDERNDNENEAEIDDENHEEDNNENAREVVQIVNLDDNIEDNDDIEDDNDDSSATYSDSEEKEPPKKPTFFDGNPYADVDGIDPSTAASLATANCIAHDEKSNQPIAPTTTAMSADMRKRKPRKAD